jgi:hypothetical protein
MIDSRLLEELISVYSLTLSACFTSTLSKRAIEYSRKVPLRRIRRRWLGLAASATSMANRFVGVRPWNSGGAPPPVERRPAVFRQMLGDLEGEGERTRPPSRRSSA